MPHTYPCWGRLRPRWATESLLSQLGWQWSASCVWVQFPLSLFKLCILQTNFIHPPTSPPLFPPLSSMTPFLKSASSKPGRWSNPRNLSPGKPMCGFNSHSASLIFVLQIFIQPPPRRLPSFPLPGRLRNASKHPHHPPFAPSLEWASPQSQLWF
jgi:hypothetical protein